MSKPKAERNASAYLQSTIFVDDDSDCRDIIRVVNLTEGEARAIRDLWVGEPGAESKEILALAPKASIEFVR